VEVDAPDELPGLGVEAVELLAVEPAADEQLAFVHGRRGDRGLTRQADLEAGRRLGDGLRVQRARCDVALPELRRRTRELLRVPFFHLFEDVARLGLFRVVL